jgi:hypothetical protein
LILGGVGGYLLFRDNDLWLRILMVLFVGAVGAFVACAIFVQLSKAITKRVCGVGDTRVLT